jgi:hypothetical protein
VYPYLDEERGPDPRSGVGGLGLRLRAVRHTAAVSGRSARRNAAVGFLLECIGASPTWGGDEIMVRGYPYGAGGRVVRGPGLLHYFKAVANDRNLEFDGKNILHCSGWRDGK